MCGVAFSTYTLCPLRLLSDQVKIERGRHLLKHRMVAVSLSLIFRDSLGSFVRRFMLPFRYCVSVFFSLFLLSCITEIMSVHRNQALIWENRPAS